MCGHGAFTPPVFAEAHLGERRNQIQLGGSFMQTCAFRHQACHLHIQLKSQHGRKVARRQLSAVAPLCEHGHSSTCMLNDAPPLTLAKVEIFGFDKS